MRLALFLAALPLLAQTPPPPGTFLAGYVSFLPSSSPKPTPGFVFATPTKLASGMIWSATGTDAYLAHGQVTTSAWSGVAIPLTTPWGSNVFMLAAPGGATTGTSSGVSLNGGMLAEVPRPRNKVLNFLIPTLVGAAVFKSSNASGTQTTIRIAWGFKVSQ